MPSKKQLKKGTIYKIGMPPKDIIPTTVKQPPRQIRPTKLPQSIPQKTKRNVTFSKSNTNHLQNLKDGPGTKQHNNTISISKARKSLKIPLILNNLIFLRKINKFPGSQCYKFTKQGSIISNRRKGHTLRKYAINKEKHYHKLNLNIHSILIQRIIKIGKSIESHRSCLVKNNISQLCVLEYYLRDQTEEQSEKRKKEEQQKIEKMIKEKKKIPKKQQPKQEGPIKIKDVKLSNVRNDNLPPQLVWISSHIQHIKQLNIRDIYNGQPLWKKIYPQHQGFPLINKSGKYWVKLYYMGREIKIQIDDLVPIVNQGNYYFPFSQNQNQIWVQIISKALLKLATFNQNPPNIIGNGQIMHYLTGLISQKIPINIGFDWQKLLLNLSDKYYLNRICYVSLYNSGKEHISPSNKIGEAADLYKYFDELNKQKYVRKSIKKTQSLIDLKKGEQNFGIHKPQIQGLVIIIQ